MLDRRFVVATRAQAIHELAVGLLERRLVDAVAFVDVVPLRVRLEVERRRTERVKDSLAHLARRSWIHVEDQEDVGSDVGLPRREIDLRVGKASPREERCDAALAKCEVTAEQLAAVFEPAFAKDLLAIDGGLVQVDAEAIDDAARCGVNADAHAVTLDDDVDLAVAEEPRRHGLRERGARHLGAKGNPHVRHAEGRRPDVAPRIVIEQELDTMDGLALERGQIRRRRRHRRRRLIDARRFGHRERRDARWGTRVCASHHEHQIAIASASARNSIGTQLSTASRHLDSRPRWMLRHCLRCRTSLAR